MTGENQVEKGGMLTWEQAVAQVGKPLSKLQWELALETYHIWLERTPCGDFPTVIEGADGIYQIASAGRESIGYFLDPVLAEAYAFACYGTAWQDAGRQLMEYSTVGSISSCLDDRERHALPTV